MKNIFVLRWRKGWEPLCQRKGEFWAEIWDWIDWRGSEWLPFSSWIWLTFCLKPSSQELLESISPTKWHNTQASTLRTWHKMHYSILPTLVLQFHCIFVVVTIAQMATQSHWSSFFFLILAYETNISKAKYNMTIKINNTWSLRVLDLDFISSFLVLFHCLFLFRIFKAGKIRPIKVGLPFKSATTFHREQLLKFLNR